jgi:hypothetical protein
MGVSESIGSLDKALKELRARWHATQSDWSDVVSRRFEQQHLELWESELKATLSSLDRMRVLLTQARRDCQ